MKPLHFILTTLALPATLGADPLPSVTLEKTTIEGLGISTTPVAKHLVVDPITATAKVIVDPAHARTIATFFPGHLSRDLVQPGEEVKEGQVLAHLKSREVSEVISKWIQADRKYQTAALLYERERKLRPQKLTTEDDFLNAKANYGEALANRTATFQTALLARSREDLLTLTEGDGIHDLTDLPVTAPIAGTIVNKSAYAGDVIELNTELFEIADLRQLLIEIQVPLKASSFLKVGDPLKFRTLVGRERSGTAKVARMNPRVDQTNLAVTVYARLDNAKLEWLVGTPVNVQLTDSAAKKVTAVPGTALVMIAGSKSLFLADGKGGFQPIAVTTGQSSQQYTEITSNLPAGARVVTSGASLLLAAWEDLTSQ